MKVYSGLLLLLLPCSLLAQSTLIDVPMQMVDTYLPKSTNQVNTAQSMDLTGFRGIPDNLTEKVIRFSNTIRGQTTYEAYLSGKVSVDEWIKTKQGLGTDSLRISPTPIHQRINTLVGTDKAGQRILIVDANNNQDFSDDRVLRYAVTLPGIERTDKGLYTSAVKAVYDTLPIVQVHIQAVDGREIVDRTAWIKPNPYNDGTTYKDPVENHFHLTLLANEHRIGSAAILGQSFRFVVISGPTGLPYNTKQATLLLYQNASTTSAGRNASEYKPQQSFILNNHRVEFVGLSMTGDKMYLADRGLAGSVILRSAGE